MCRIWLIAALVFVPWVVAAQVPFSCTRIDAGGIIRAEGVTELLPDIVVECTNGRASSGTPPIYTILLTIQGTWAIRPSFAVPASGSVSTAPISTPPWNEALLLIDDPLPAVQAVCLPAPGFGSCAPHDKANIFPARRLQTNLIGFTEIPMASPGEGKLRRFRITNLRVNVPLSVSKTNVVTTSIQMFDYLGNLVPLGTREGVPAKALPSYIVRLLNAAGRAVDEASPALLASPSVVPLNTPIPTVAFQAVFEEGFAGAFRRRNVATTALDPTNVQSQNVPGLTYSTESGFLDNRLPLTNALSLAGSADSGTRLRLNFDSIPKNVLIWVSIRDCPLGTLMYDADSPKALLTYTNPNGDGPFSPVSPYIPGWAQLYVDGGKAQAVWEIVSADPEAVDHIAFSVALTSQGTAGPGAATLRGSIAPFVEILSASGGPASDNLTVFPRFQVLAKNLPAFTLSNSIKTDSASITSAASFSGAAIAPGSFATAFSGSLGGTTISSDYPWPLVLDGLQVQLVDATGVARFAPLLVVSPQQVNFLIPESTRTGAVLVNLMRLGVTVATGISNIQAVAPGLFSADGSGSGAAAGSALRLTATGSSPPQPLATRDGATGIWRPLLIGFSNAEPVYLSIYGTGIRNRTSLATLAATIGGQPVPVLYAGAQSDLPGLDQINLGPLPAALHGRGELDLVVTVDGQPANRLRIAVE